jgi:Uma2 family endonuclease
MSSATPPRARIDDLLAVQGKVELIGGKVVRLPGVGPRLGRIISKILRSLDNRAQSMGRGDAFASTLVYAVPKLRSGRESFSPDESYYAGPLPKDEMRPIDGPPTLAVEVRGERDYGPAAERDMAEKRADYFAAGTPVVWDVDPVAGLVHVYRADAPATPTTYGRGQMAEAEPAVPGWRPAVDSLFPAS